MLKKCHVDSELLTVIMVYYISFSYQYYSSKFNFKRFFRYLKTENFN